MPTSPPETETVVINGFTFSYRKRYAAGHVCTQAEATVLNQQLKKNLRRNFADQVPPHGEIVPEGIGDLIIQAFRDYEASYHFGGPDPITAEAFVIALEVVKRRLKGEGKLVSDHSRADLTTLADAVLAGPQRDQIMSAAKQRVVAIQAAAAKEARRMDGADA